MKYKVGDKVKIREDLIIGEGYGEHRVVSDMTEFIGDIVTITNVFPSGYGIKEDNGEWYWSEDMFEEINMILDDSTNKGGSTSYYELPKNARELQDLIEFKDMGFSLGNILKATYRLGNCDHSDRIRDLNKIIWFANRELNLEKKKVNK